jgi:deoxyribonuclease V
MGDTSDGVLHSWDVTPKEAIAIQNQLCALIIREDQYGPLRRIAGIDVGLENGNLIARAAVVVLSYPGLNLLETAVARRPVSFPYIPGLLSFREVPVVLDALSHLTIPIDLLFCDGQGLAHPRRFGLACHLGLTTGLPSIGNAKSRLTGEHLPPGDEFGSWSPLMDGDEVIGAALRTHSGAKPIYVSIGHRVCLATAIALTMRCTRGYRIPQPTRLAHNLASHGRINA